jgi:IS5 family transposase
MRLACPEERLDCLPISEVKRNLECRDEIIPILRALQPGYADAERRRELLARIGKDVNGSTDRKRGRRGMNYWEIAVLAAARLGCNLDYDKLQDLAENHRRLRRIMGSGDWQDDEVDFDWRRIEDNLIKLRPETLQKINALIVKAGHVLEPEAIEPVRTWPRSCPRRASPRKGRTKGASNKRRGPWHFAKHVRIIPALNP